MTRAEIHIKYNASEKGQARRRRYEAKHPERNQRRLRAGRSFLGMAETVEQAAAVNQHIQRRLRAFKQRQSERAQMEGMASG